MIIEDKLSPCQAGFVEAAVAPERSMPRETLLDFFTDLSRITGTFLVHDDGFRVRSWSYAEVAAAAEAFARTLAAHGIGHDDKVVVWGENRPEWIVAFWGTVLRGAIVVPIDYRASPDFLGKVARIVEARVVLVGDEVELPAGTVADAVPVWRLAGLGSVPGAPKPDAAEAGAATTASLAPFTPTRDTVVEIIFTSGATAEPKGVVITHRNILANIVPIEHEMQKYRGYARPFMPLRFLNLLPLSHMFGQAMATFVPPMLSGEVMFMRSLRPRDIVQQIKARRISVLVSVPKILDVLREHVAREFPHAAVPRSRPDALVEAVVEVPPGAPRLRLEVLGRRRRRGAARSRARRVLGTPRLPRRAGLRPDRDRAHRHAQPSAQDAPRIGRQADRRRRGEDRRGRRDPRPRRQRHQGLLRRARGHGTRRSRTAGCTPATSAAPTSRAASTSRAARRR